MTKPILNTQELERVLKKRTIIDEKTGCWIYIGGNHTSGHCRIVYKYKRYYVHRLSAFLYLGLDLDDLTKQANHKVTCLNPNCWNPEHLYIGTQAENIRDIHKVTRMKLRGLL